MSDLSSKPMGTGSAASGGLLAALSGRVRGRILLSLCAMYFITYADRVNIATAAPFIQKELALSDVQLGMVLSAFAVPYAFFQMFGGLIGDRFGPRRVLTIVGLVWAVATIATGFSVGLVSLFAARLALGFGEGATFPTATHAMAKWMPRDRRAFAQGITHAASRLGNAVTPIAVAVCISLYNWRLSFWALGVLSLVWVFFWRREYRDSPAEHPKITRAELEELPEDQWTDHHKKVPWVPILKRILPVTFVDFCYGWSLWVFLTWIPSFFARSYSLDLKHFAFFTTLVLFAGVIGDALGGTLSDSVLRRTGNLKIARRTNLLIGLIGAFVFIVPVLMMHSIWLVAASLALSFFFLELTNSVLWAIPMDIAPDHAGMAGGLMNTGFGIAGVISPLFFGAVLEATGSWVVPFSMSAALLFVGAVVSLSLNPEPMGSPPEETSHGATRRRF